MNPDKRKSRTLILRLRAAEQLPRPLLRWWHGRLLRKVVASAYEHVVMYRQALDRAGIRPQDVRRAEDIVKLPILDKASFSGLPVEEVINLSRPSFGWVKSSGTSGKPFTFLSSELNRFAEYNDFMCERFLYWKGASVRDVDAARIAKIKIRSGSTGNRLFIPVSDFLADPARVYASLLEFKPDVLESYQSILHELARYAENASPALRIPYIVAFGEMLPASSRTYIEHVFGGTVFNRYGVEEIGVIGTECEAHDGFHVHVDSALVEIIGDNDTPAAAGKSGRVVATALHNYLMPFIRYDTGDKGRMSTEACTCGLRTPRIWIEGRYASFVDLGGRRIHHLEFDGVMDGFTHSVYQYQIAKTGADSIMARIVRAQGFSDSSLPDIERALRKIVGADVRVRVQAVESIEITPRGKTQILVDETAQ